MKSKLLNLGLLLTSLLGHHEWGESNQYFIFQMEWEMILKMYDNFSAGLHPFILLPMLGQALLLFTLFQKEPGKTITFIAIGCLSLLLFFILLIGFMNLNFKTILSFVPFILLIIMTLWHHRRNGLESQP